MNKTAKQYLKEAYERISVRDQRIQAKIEEVSAAVVTKKLKEAYSRLGIEEDTIKWLLEQRPVEDPREEFVLSEADRKQGEKLAEVKKTSDQKLREAMSSWYFVQYGVIPDKHELDALCYRR